MTRKKEIDEMEIITACIQKLPSSAQTGYLSLAELSWLYTHDSHPPSHPPTRVSIKTVT